MFFEKAHPGGTPPPRSAIKWLVNVRYTFRLGTIFRMRHGLMQEGAPKRTTLFHSAQQLHVLHVPVAKLLLLVALHEGQRQQEHLLAGLAVPKASGALL